MFKYILIIIAFCHLFVFARKDDCYTISKAIISDLQECEYDTEDENSIWYQCANAIIMINKEGGWVLSHTHKETKATLSIASSLNKSSCAVTLKDELGVTVMGPRILSTTQNKAYKVYGLLKKKLLAFGNFKSATEECTTSWQCTDGICTSITCD